MAGEALTIYKKSNPDNWCRFDSESLLGDSLVGQKRYAEAEPLLLSSYEGLVSREFAITDRFRAHIDRALERIVRTVRIMGQAAEGGRMEGQAPSGGSPGQRLRSAIVWKTPAIE